MDKGMERAVVKAMKLDNKDACLLVKEEVKAMFNEYKELRGYMPTEWEEYLASMDDECDIDYMLAQARAA
jgi:hypothetical protein